MFLYRKKRFLDHITYSLNYFEEGTKGKKKLILRTLQVLPKEDLLPSNFLFKLKMFKAIRNCSEEDPFIKMDQKAMNILMPAIINGISSLFGADILQNQKGHPQKQFLLAVTCEKYGDIKSQKIRVMIIDPKELDGMSFKDTLRDYTFEDPSHKDRIRTLLVMKLHRQNQRVGFSSEVLSYISIPAST